MGHPYEIALKAQFGYRIEMVASRMISDFNYVCLRDLGLSLDGAKYNRNSPLRSGESLVRW